MYRGRLHNSNMFQGFAQKRNFCNFLDFENNFFPGRIFLLKHKSKFSTAYRFLFYLNKEVWKSLILKFIFWPRKSKEIHWNFKDSAAWDKVALQIEFYRKTFLILSFKRKPICCCCPLKVDYIINHWQENLN